MNKSLIKHVYRQLSFILTIQFPKTEQKLKVNESLTKSLATKHNKELENAYVHLKSPTCPNSQQTYYK